MRLLIAMTMCCFATMHNAAAMQVPDGPAALIERLQFIDGKPRTVASFSNQTVLMIYFCGHCPGAASELATTIKSVHDWIEQEKLPVWFVLATPDFDVTALKSFDKDRGYNMTHALYASDPSNRMDISLKNIFQPLVFVPGQRTAFLDSLDQLKTMVTPQTAGSYRFTPDGITKPQIKELWWAVERGRPGALKALVSAGQGKQATGPGAEAAGLLERVKAAAQTREAELAAGPVSIETLEAIEVFCMDYEGLDVKKMQARYRELKAAKELKDDLRARDIYRQCHELLASSKPAEQAAGKEGLATLAKKFPATVYGKKATAGVQ